MSQIIARSGGRFHTHLEPIHRYVSIVSVLYLFYYVGAQALGQHVWEHFHPILNALHHLIALAITIYLFAGWWVRRTVKKRDIVGLSRALNGRVFTRLFGKPGRWTDISPENFVRFMPTPASNTRRVEEQA